MRAVPKLSLARFLQKPVERAVSRCRIQPWLRTLVGKDSRMLPAYRPLIGLLDACGGATESLDKLRKALAQQDVNTALEYWREINALPPLKQADATFGTLAEKFNGYGPPQLESVIGELAKSQVDTLVRVWQNATPSQLYVYILPRLVCRLSKLPANKSHIRALIHELAKVSSVPVQFQAINFAMNAYLHAYGPSYREFQVLFGPLDARIEPHLHPYVSSKIHLHCSHNELCDLFILFKQHKVPMGPKGMSTFLRALFSGSDRGEELVLVHYQDTRFSLGFYYFLVKQLIKRKYQQKVDWIFENVLFKIVEHDTRHISLILHMLALRTIAFEGIQNVVPLLEQMGGRIDEPTWLTIFQEFRRLGRIDRCYNTVDRALEQGHKLSMPFVSEILMMTAQNYSVATFLGVLYKIVPEMRRVVKYLGITGALDRVVETSATAPTLSVGPEDRGFAVHRVHDSWLVILYQSVLNNIDDPKVILMLYSHLKKYVAYSDTPIKIDLVDQFVLRLTRLRTPATIDTAEYILHDALTTLRIQRPNNGRNNCRSLEALCRVMELDGSKQSRLIFLIDLALAHPGIAARGKSFVKIRDNLLNTNPQRAKILERWASDLGAVMPE